MHARRRPRSLLRTLAWVYFGPAVVIGGLGLILAALSVLAIAVQLLGVLLSYLGR